HEWKLRECHEPDRIRSSYGKYRSQKKWWEKASKTTHHRYNTVCSSSLFLEIIGDQFENNPVSNSCCGCNKQRTNRVHMYSWCKCQNNSCNRNTCKNPHQNEKWLEFIS